MKSNNHLQLEEREKITVLQGRGLSIRSIAKELGRHPSTICREMKRKDAVYYQGIYIGSQTHKRVQKTWKETHKRINKFLNQRNMHDFIEKYLKYGYSPAIISHLIQERFNEKVSHETLYIYIYSPKRKLFRYLLRRKIGRLHRKPTGRSIKIGSYKVIPNRIDVELRNELANKRLEFGHFEVVRLNRTSFSSTEERLYQKTSEKQ